MGRWRSSFSTGKPSRRKFNQLILHRALRVVLTSVILMPLFACAGSRPNTLGVKDSRLATCPGSPNCVSSDDDDAGHTIPAFQLILPADEAWRAVQAVVAKLPRSRIITVTEDYLYAECSSAFLGFVDDLELHLRPAQNVIAIRSAARFGYSDLGVNRRRVQELRSLLAQQGVVR